MPRKPAPVFHQAYPFKIKVIIHYLNNCIYFSNWWLVSRQTNSFTKPINCSLQRTSDSTQPFHFYTISMLHFQKISINIIISTFLSSLSSRHSKPNSKICCILAHTHCVLNSGQVSLFFLLSVGSCYKIYIFLQGAHSITCKFLWNEEGFLCSKQPTAEYRAKSQKHFHPLSHCPSVRYVSVPLYLFFFQKVPSHPLICINTFTAFLSNHLNKEQEDNCNNVNAPVNVCDVPCKKCAFRFIFPFCVWFASPVAVSCRYNANNLLPLLLLS